MKKNANFYLLLQNRKDMQLFGEEKGKPRSFMYYVFLRNIRCY